mmetsp:Transcript_30456/g.71038  ORF Transcript_30456/g.71038 Transcript_30456/m.71038 type:complete len:187 (-) Transcript_30456:2-562(-)
MRETTPGGGAGSHHSFHGSGASDVTGVELGSVYDGSPSERRADRADRAADYIIKDTLLFILQSCAGAAIIIAGVFALHSAIRSHQDAFASASKKRGGSHHHTKWAGTQSVSNNVRLEVERHWLDRSRDTYKSGDTSGQSYSGMYPLQSRVSVPIAETPSIEAIKEAKRRMQARLIHQEAKHRQNRR